MDINWSDIRQEIQVKSYWNFIFYVHQCIHLSHLQFLPAFDRDSKKYICYLSQDRRWDKVVEASNCYNWSDIGQEIQVKSKREKNRENK